MILTDSSDLLLSENVTGLAQPYCVVFLRGGIAIDWVAPSWTVPRKLLMAEYDFTEVTILDALPSHFSDSSSSITPL